MFVAALILRSTIGVLRETVQVLMDGVPKGVDFRAVGAALARIPGVLQVHDLHVWSMVPERSALSAHVLIEDIADWPAILRQARASLSQQFHIDHVTLQPEWLRPAADGKAVPIKPL
jgi:cobalt-zinc-cadmium efflux system protein